MSIEKLFVLHTNDIHSRFEHMSRIAGTLQQLKQRRHPHPVLTLDIGDHIDRMRLETEGSEGLANIAVMNYTGYEAAVPGNNEGLTLDKRLLRKLYAEHASFKVIGSNMMELGKQRPPDWMEVSLIVMKGNLRVGLIGLTAAFNDFYRPLGWELISPFKTAAQLVEKLRAETDILIVMSHLGLPIDEQLARTVPGIDCILGGHTHHLLREPIFIKDTMICAAGKFGAFVGEAEFHYDTDKRKIIHCNAACYETEAFDPDPLVDRIIEEYKQKAKSKLSEAIVNLPNSLHNSWNTESELGNLLAAGLREWTSAEIGIVNAGQILSELPAGAISREMLLDICPSPINPCRMTLKGEDILRALEEALLVDFIHKPLMGFGFRGKLLGTLCLDGIEVEYNVSRPDYEKVLKATVKGKPLEPDRQYDVGTIDMFTFGVGYPIFKEGTVTQFFMPEFLRDILEVQLKDQAKIRRSSVKRWKSVRDA